MINFRSSDSCRRIDRIARAFYRSGTTGAVTLDVSKAFDRVWYAGLLHKVKRYGITGQISGLFSSFLSNRRSSSRNYTSFLVCSWSLLFFVLGLHFSYYTPMTFLILSVILLFMLMILLSTLSVIGHLTW